MSNPIVLLLYRANVDQTILSIVRQAIPIDAFEIIEWKDLNKDARVWMEHLRKVIEDQLCYRILILMQDEHGDTNENVAFELGFTSGYQLGRAPYNLARGMPTGRTIPIATKEALEGKTEYPTDLRTIAHISYPCVLDAKGTVALQDEVKEFVTLKSSELLFLLPRKVSCLRYFSDLKRDRQKQVNDALVEFSEQFTKRHIETDVSVVVSTISESFQSLLDELERSGQLTKGSDGLSAWSVNQYCRFLTDTALECPDAHSFIACAERVPSGVSRVAQCANQISNLHAPETTKHVILSSLKHLEESIAVKVDHDETPVQASHWVESLGHCFDRTCDLSEEATAAFLGSVAKSVEFAAESDDSGYRKAEGLISSVSKDYFYCKVKLDDAATNDAFTGNSLVTKNLQHLLHRATANHLAEPNDPGRELRNLAQSAVSVAAILGHPEYQDSVKAHQATIIPHLRKSIETSAEDVRELESLVQQYSALQIDKSRIPSRLVKVVERFHESIGQVIFACTVNPDSKATSLSSINGEMSELAIRISNVPSVDEAQLDTWESILQQTTYEIRAISDHDLSACKSQVSARIKDAIRKASSTKWAREVDGKLGPALSCWSSCAIACLAAWLVVAFIAGWLEAGWFKDADSSVWRYIFHPSVRTKWNEVVLVGVGLGIACAFSGVPRFIRFREFKIRAIKPVALFAAIVAVSFFGWVPSNLGRLGDGATSEIPIVNTVRALLTFIAIVSTLSLIPHATRNDRRVRSVVAWLSVKALAIFAFSVAAKIATKPALYEIINNWESPSAVFTATLPVLTGAMMIAIFYFIFEAFVMAYMTYQNRVFTLSKESS